VVAAGGRSERELSLERDLATERTSHAATAHDKRERERRIAELEDELHRLRQTLEPPAPPRKKGRDSYTLIEAVFEDEA
jgi:hypothetical protein